MAKKTPEEKAQLDDLKAQADAAGIEYGGNIGIDTLAARIDEDAPEAIEADEQAAPVDADPAKIMVEVNSTNPNPVRLMVNGKRLADIWQGVATDVSEEALEALVNSAVDFVFIHGQKE
jgi:ubiquitin